MLRGDAGRSRPPRSPTGAAGARGVPARGRPAGAADARADRRVGRRGARASSATARGRSGSSTASASRSTAGATTRPTCGSSPGPSTTSPTGVPELVEAVLRAAASQPSCSTARRSRCGPTAGRGRSRRPPAGSAPAATSRPGAPHAADAVRLRRPARRRRGPARRVRRRERTAALAERAARRSCWCRAWSPPTPADGARRSSTDALARGHEGVVVKALDAPYAAGRRGAGWLKVKPRAHPRPRRPGRRVGPRPAAAAGCRTCTSGARDPSRRVRHARQDVQGPDRRDARVADRGAAGARGRRATTGRCSCGPSWSSRSRSTACRRRRATPAASRCASPASCATAPTRPPSRPTPSTTCSRSETGVSGSQETITDTRRRT